MGGDQAGEIEATVLVAGGGLIGLTLGIALAQSGVRVAVVDQADPAALLAAAYDGRASAIARGSKQALTALGVWAHLEAAAQPILEIRVSDGQVGRPASPLFLHYRHQELSAAEGAGEALGHIVENREIRRALRRRAEELTALQLIAPATLTRLERTSGAVLGELADGRRVNARLAVAAEGRRSPLRRQAAIRTHGWDYGQDAIVATVLHEKPHNGVAHEHFLPSGPFALLPMTDDGQGRHRSSLVWTEKRCAAAYFMGLKPEDFAAEMMRRFGDSLGRLALEGGRWRYPLSLQNAERYVAERLALVGDAAHGMHPIAGQGLNLGLRDVAALAEVLVEARRLGLDPGSAAVLARYQRWRRFDSGLLLAATDGLNRLFSNDLAPLRLARDLGLAAVDRLPPLKRLFMRHAMGLVGKLPRLIEGRAI
jgi:2-octaprenyl-6-methoxyphenol hydroxylase